MLNQARFSIRFNYPFLLLLSQTQFFKAKKQGKATLEGWGNKKNWHYLFLAETNYGS